MKIRSYNSSNKYGLVVKNVKELLDKGCKLLKVRGVAFVSLVIEQVSFVSCIPINRNSKKKQSIFMNYSFSFASAEQVEDLWCMNTYLVFRLS